MTKQIDSKTGKPFPRGARPTPRNKLAASIPFRARQAPPNSFFILPRKLSYFLNNVFGDCVTAEEAFNKACGGVFISDETVRAWAGGNNVLNGADLKEVLDLMARTGFSQDGNHYNDGAAQAVDYADSATMRAAIFQAGLIGGCIKLGVAANQLPSDAGNTNGWFLKSDSPDSNLDHSTSCCGFGTAVEFCTAMNAAYGITVAPPSGFDVTKAGYAMFTWNTIGFMLEESLVNMTGEAWIRNPSTIILGGNPPTPDDVYVTNSPVPPPPPPGPGPGPDTPTISGFTVTMSDGSSKAYSVLPADSNSEVLRQKLGLTPAQWLALIMQILAIIGPFLNPPKGASA